MIEKGYTLAELADVIGATVKGDVNCKIYGVASLANAKLGDVSFLEDKKHACLLETSEASAIVVSKECVNMSPMNALLVTNPKLDFIKLTTLFKPRILPKPGLHPTVVLGENCQIAQGVHLGAYVVIGDNVDIGANTVIRSGTHLGDQVKVGESCYLYSQVTVYDEVVIGDRAIIHSGAVIGADGFGFAPNAQREWIKIPQIGRVLIGDDVEIGANTTIDRGALDDTQLGNGVKIDNLVMIAHNITVGDHTIIAGCTGIAGSVTIGKHCIIGGAVTMNGHIRIVDNVILVGGAQVFRPITEPGVYGSGMLIQPFREWRKGIIRYWKLGDVFERLKKLEAAQLK